MKPRLADAPNGIVGSAGGGAKRGDLLGQSALNSHSSHAATSLPVDLLGSNTSFDANNNNNNIFSNSSNNNNNNNNSLLGASSPRKELNTPANVGSLRPTPARGGIEKVAAPAATTTTGGEGGRGNAESLSSSKHRRTLSDSQGSSGQLFTQVRETSPRRGSHRLTRVVENTGPLKQDTRQQELVEKAVGQQPRASGLFTLRGRTPRNPRKLDDSMDSGGDSSNSSLTFDSSFDSKQRSSKRGTSMFARSSGSTLQLPGSPRSSNGGGSGGTDGNKTLTPAHASPDVPPTISIAAGPQNHQNQQPQEKRGFFAKLKGLIKTDAQAKAESASKMPKPMFSAAELEARERQLAAAGFSQLPGTLLSRAKGEEVDPKFLLKWRQFDLRREIGEGAYAMVYLADANLADGSKKEVALKELKLQGNEQNEDLFLEASSVADAIVDCGFETVAETIRLASSLLRQPDMYREARTLLQTSLSDFKRNIDADDEACAVIIAVMEGLIALAPPSPQTTIPAGKGAPQRLMEDILREVEVLSKLWHKNIVEFVGCCVELPHLAIAMQYAHKGPLSELLINEDFLFGWDLRIKWARETAEAVNYLHSLRPIVIHRDLKADNILIDGNNTALVTDFGLSKAKVLNMMNPAGAPSAVNRQAHPKYKSFVEFSEVAGTPSYLAPELWRNEPYTESVDVYSFGVVLWEILARDAPFRELDNEALMLALRDQSLRPTIPKWCPEAYKLLMQRCWSGNASQRPTFDQILKLLKILEDHLFQWPLPENYSLDEDVQAQHVLAFAKEKEDKEQVMKAAERKLLAAQMQLKTAKLSGNSSVDAPNTTVMLSPTPVHHSDQQKSDQKGDQPSKRKKSPVQEVFLK